MYRKSDRQKRLEYLSKLMNNGLRFAILSPDGTITSTFHYRIEANRTRLYKGQQLKSLQELYDETYLK